LLEILITRLAKISRTIVKRNSGKKARMFQKFLPEKSEI